MPMPIVASSIFFAPGISPCSNAASALYAERLLRSRRIVRLNPSSWSTCSGVFVPTTKNRDDNRAIKNEASETRNSHRPSRLMSRELNR